ncbi:hypothetical protein RBSWK_04544 [Rhodopirellula baltica SWK14]|uniref:Uncharacterized protein n=1 Tax=Rhodopirellula baltica SWK14 TaxID=993516 RepID=L7CEN2_RHOBT|nr:hypothetical protein RBSWK_04544 [Rhodopirellula baltica SWK14]
MHPRSHSKHDVDRTDNDAIDAYQAVDLVAYRMTIISRWALAPVGI